MASPASTARIMIPVREDFRPVRFDARIRVCKDCGQSRAGHSLIHDFR
jgi:hypothetical protein